MIAIKHRSTNIILFVLAALFLGVVVMPQKILSARKRGQPAGASGILSDLFQFPQGTLHQFKSDGTTPIPEGGLVAAGTAVFAISFQPAGITPLRLQVEVRPFGAAFTGTPTAASGILLLTRSGSVAVTGLAGGSYHWRARLANVLTGSVSGWQEFGAAGNADFTVALREPVVIVPGISGSVLQKTSDGSEAWPNVGKMLVSPSDDYLDALALDPAGNDTQSTIRVAGILKAATLSIGGAVVFSDNFYGNLIDAFKADGYVEDQDLFAAPYDWRKDIAGSVPALAAKISQALARSATGKINIIAHSMGGLVLKKYLAGLSDASFLDKVVLAGVPELGAPDAYKILNYGDDLGIPVVNQDEIKKIAQNMPAIYELLPSRKYITVNGSYVQNFQSGGDQFSDYDSLVGAMTSNPADSRNAALLNLADGFHQAIDGRAVGAPNVYNIVGCGKPTIDGFSLYDDGVIDLARGDGDGMVPEVSAMDMADAAHNYFVQSGVTGIDHVGLVGDPRPITLIKNIMDGNAAALPQGISAALADCVAPQGTAATGDETTVEFSTHGDGDLGVYDSEDRYTGVTASGTVALGIPGSDYEKLGANVFITVPAGDAYRAIGDTQPDASDTFEMKVRGYHGAAADREATYLLAPTNGTSTTAELDFSGFGKNLDLHIGRKGHPGFTGVHHPDALFSSPAAMKDSTPPIITVSALPREVLQNSTATISFSAVDAGSGIGVLTATLDGLPVANGAIVAFTNPGMNVLKIEAVDKAGNPRVKEIKFEVAPAPKKP
jgi:hypothetical protein